MKIRIGYEITEIETKTNEEISRIGEKLKTMNKQIEKKERDAHSDGIQFFTISQKKL